MLLNRLLYLRQRRLTEKYRKVFGRLPDFENPSLFGEKIQWRKLFDRNPLWPLFCDKLSARDYVKKKAPEIEMSEVLWTGTDPEAIPFDKLPTPFVIKPNGQSRTLVFIQSPDEVDREELVKTCKKWLRQVFGQNKKEWAFAKVKRKIVVENMLVPRRGNPPLRDIRCYVFDGKVRMFQLGIPFLEDKKRKVHPVHTFYDENWKQLPYYKLGGQTGISPPQPQPSNLEEMKALAEKLGEGLDHLRVDFYLVDDGIYFSELTVYSASGLATIGKDKTSNLGAKEDFHAYLGKYWSIPRVRPEIKLIRGLLC